MKTSSASKAKPFLDHTEALVTRLGMPAGIGRIFGWLMIGEPACQTAEEISRVVDMPQETVTAILDGLVKSATVDRVELPSPAEPCYALRSPQELLDRRIHQMGELRDLTEEGLRLVGNESLEVRARLESFRDLYVSLIEDFRTISSKPRS